jgi:PAS domain S-box-containing protein
MPGSVANRDGIGNALALNADEPRKVERRYRVRRSGVIREPLTSADEFFRTSLDHLCVTGFDGWFRRLNPSWTRTLGWTEEELLSRPVLDFIHPEDRERTLEARQRLHDGKEMGPLVNRYRCKDGTYRWFEWRSIGHPDRRLVYAAARDISDQKQAEEHLRQSRAREEKLQRQLIFADRKASVGTLAAGVAHEINNPLAFVIGNITLILEELERLDLPPEQRTNLLEMASDIRTGAERIRKIVRGLKTFSRAPVEQLSVFDVRPVLEQSINLAFNEIRHRARLVKDYGRSPFVQADEARLGQVFVNLLVNAAQAIAEGDADANEIRIVTATDESGRAVIEVRDTGPGIPAAIIDRIFDPFFTTKPQGVGTGLGLSICHNIVTGLGGELTVASAEGVGSTFRVTLPAATGAPEVPPHATPAPERSLACASVLVVDDERAVGQVLKRALGEHEVTAVLTAQEALDLLEAGHRFHVVFSDLMMPQMSGMEFYDELTRRFPDVARRVVFLTGGAFTPAADAFLARVPNERLEKPFDPRVLRDVVQRSLLTQL